MPVLQSDSDDLGVAVCKRWDKMDSNASNWVPYWDEIAKYFVPKKDNAFGGNISGQRTEDFLFDNTSVHVNELLASAMHGMLTNPASVWLGFGTGDDKLDMDDQVRRWFQETAFRLVQILNNSNFQTQIHEYYLDIGSFGTGVLKIEDDEQNILTFDSSPIYEFRVAENKRGLIDTVYRKSKWTLKQLMEEFKDKVDEEIKQMFAQNPDGQEEVVHAIEPRSIQQIDVGIPMRMPYRSTYVLVKNKKVLRESGFKENPYVVARWSKISGETYGRSPAMKSLADVKMLNAMMKVVIQAGQITIAPPTQVPDDGVLLPIKMNPLGVNFYRAGSKDRIEPINLNARPDLGLDMIDNVRARIRQAFFIDQLQLSEDNPQMTATEVLQRTEEKLRLMSPMMGRQHNEFLEPTVSRAFRICTDRNQFEEMPSRLADALASNKTRLQVKYISQIAKAQRSGEADNFTRFLGVVAPILETQPGVAEVINGENVIRRIAGALGLHQDMIRDVKEMKAIREQQAAAQEQENAVEQGVAASQISKNMAG